MAYTRIHAVKTTVHKTIAYICNPEKTNGELLISSFGTSPQTAKYDFQYALSKTDSSDPNKAFHLIQSFAPGEVSYEEAHQIGIELTDKLLEGKYAYVIATHIDKGHCHNHICFCAADNINHKKYHDCKKSYYNIRSISDALCQEHNLSIIIPESSQGKKYNEWAADKEGTSWKKQLQKDIDDLIQIAVSYENFIELIKAKGYEVKGESFGEKSAKYISFKPTCSKNFIRGRDKSLGAEYTKERIKERIEKRQQELSKKKVPFPKKKPYRPVMDYSQKSLIDTTNEKFQNSPGLQHWADIENLKIAASSYSSADSIQELQDKIKEKTSVSQEAKSTVIEIEHELKRMGEIIKYAQQYKDNEPYHYRYLKSKNPDHYYRTHDMQLVLYDGAVNMLERYRVDVKRMDVEKMKRDYEILVDKKMELQRTYKNAQKEVRDIEKRLANIQQYISLENTQKKSMLNTQHHSL